MAMEITNNYSSYAAQSMAESNAAGGTKKKGSDSSKTGSTENYANQLAKLVPSVEFNVGNTYQTAKTGKTLTVNPKLLEKMQNDPEFEKEMKELIKGVESMSRLSERMNDANGWKTVFRHSYIDENGQYRHVALIRNEYGYKMSEKLREERRKNSEKLIEKQKEKAAKKKKELQEKLKEKFEEKRAWDVGKEDEEITSGKAEKLINEKIAASEDGMIYIDDAEIKEIIEAIKEDGTDKSDAADTKGLAQPGANLDIKV